MKSRAWHGWIWLAAGVAAVGYWLFLSALPSHKAAAQIGGPQPPYQRFGGPAIVTLGNRPVGILGGAQLGYGYFGAFQQAPFDPVAYYNGMGYLPAGTDAPVLQGASYSTGVYAIARTNDVFDAAYDNEGRLSLQWQGETAAARSLHFALLDRQRSVLKEVTVDRLPAETRFDRNEKAVYAQAIVVYVNGTTNAMVFPLQPPPLKTEAPTAPKEAKEAKEPAPANGGNGTPRQ